MSVVIERCPGLNRRSWAICLPAWLRLLKPRHCPLSFSILHQRWWAEGTQFQKLLGLMAAAFKVTPFGLLHMRPLQWWLKTKGFSPRGNPLRMIKVTGWCFRALDMWRKPWFLSQGPELGVSCRHVMLTTDSSLTGWGMVMSGHTACGLLSGRNLTWHFNCLEMLAVFRALKFFLPDMRDAHWQHIGGLLYQPPGGLRSRPLHKLENLILLWSQDKLLSLRVIYIPVRRYLISQVGGTIFHPRPELWKLWVSLLRGHNSWLLVSQPRLLRPSSNPELLLRGNCTA